MVYGGEKCVIGNLLRFKSDLQKKSVGIKLDGYNKSKTYDFEHNAEEAKANAKEGDRTLLSASWTPDPQTFW